MPVSFEKFKPTSLYPSIIKKFIIISFSSCFETFIYYNSWFHSLKLIDGFS